jgi:hypothetical protein
MIGINQLRLTPTQNANPRRSTSSLCARLSRRERFASHESHYIPRWQLSILLFVARGAPNARSRAMSRRRGQVLA